MEGWRCKRALLFYRAGLSLLFVLVGGSLLGLSPRRVLRGAGYQSSLDRWGRLWGWLLCSRAWSSLRCGRGPSPLRPPLRQAAPARRHGVGRPRHGAAGVAGAGAAGARPGGVERHLRPHTLLRRCLGRHRGVARLRQLRRSRGDAAAGLPGQHDRRVARPPARDTLPPAARAPAAASAQNSSSEPPASSTSPTSSTPRRAERLRPGFLFRAPFFRARFACAELQRRAGRCRTKFERGDGGGPAWR